MMKTMQDFWHQVLEFSQKITTEVGEQLLKDFGSVQADEKADGSLVTQSDRWADFTITNAIREKFPEHGILSEEGQHTFPDSLWCWIIDPLDGTTNFTRGIPIWGISLGLLYQGTPVFGYIYFPPIRQAFHGFYLEETDFEGTSGGFLNEHPIRPSGEQPSDNHFFNLCSRSVSLAADFPCKIRMLGVASYNFLTVAMGAVLGGLEATPKIWDIAGAWVIIKATGCQWISLNQEELFPLKIGENYGQKSYPSLVIGQAFLAPIFLPLVEHLGGVKKPKKS